MTKKIPEGLLRAQHVCAFFNISNMSLWRWLEDDSLNFPTPTYIKNRRYWRQSDIEAWLERQPKAAKPKRQRVRL